MKRLALFATLALALAACTNLLAFLLPQQNAPSVVSGDATRGAELFVQGKGEAPACSNCHRTEPDGGGFFSIGPNLSGVSGRAGTRIEGMAAEAYLRESIVHPVAFLVPGFRNMMYGRYAEQLSEQDIADLIAYLLTL